MGAEQKRAALSHRDGILPGNTGGVPPAPDSGASSQTLLITRNGILLPYSDANRQRSDIVPLGVDQYFIDGSPRRGLDLTQQAFRVVDQYIDGRLEKFIMRASERNRQLLEEKPWLREFLTYRITKRTTMPQEDISEDMLLQELTTHMVEDKEKYQDRKGNYYLPYDDIHPNDVAFKFKRFGWDTEMHVAAFLGSNLEGKMELAKNSMRNAKYLFDVLGYVPNGTSRALDDRTQPARHTRTIRMIYDAMTPEERELPENQEFFAEMWSFAEKEYWEVFHPLDPQNPYSKEDNLHQNVVRNGQTHQRYGTLDEAVYHDLSACGSGRDFSLDTYGREADHTRIDMQTDFYNAEEDFAWWQGLHKKSREIEGGIAEKTEGEMERDEIFWKLRMAQREARVIQNHYDPDKQWFYHYDFMNDRKSWVAAVTGILALRMLKDPEERQKVVKQFEERFVHHFGIGLTDPETLPKQPRDEQIASIESDPGMQQTLKEQYEQGQWDGDNQFYNITKHVVDELKAAGEYRLAARVMEGALIGLVRYFHIKQVINGNGQLAEKIDSRRGDMGHGAKYGDQDELVMPMGLFKLFMQDLPEVYKQIEEGNLSPDPIGLITAPAQRSRETIVFA